MSSLWTENIEMPEFPTLEKDIRTQVLIIGGGMAGVLCAYFLQQAGVDYCLLEKDRICQGVTGHTTAKITAQHGLIYEKSLQSMGQERAELFLKANLRAVENYKSLGRFLDCDMEETDSYLYSVRERRKLESEIQALRSLGFQADYIAATELPFEVEGAIRFPRQAQFQPLKFAAGISKNLRIYEHSELREMTEYFALTEKGSVAAEKIIIATHFPFINTRGSYYLKLYQNRSYVLACAYGKNLKGMYLEADNIGLSPNQLAGIEDMELFERHGAPVEEKIFADMSHAAEEIAETLKLGEEEYETAAVVLRTEKEAEHMWLLLKEILGEKGFDVKERLSYLDRNSTSFKKGLTVTTFYLAKGLEFDQVFAVFPQKDQTPLVRQARYIAATRALHELHMYEVEK